MPNIILTNSIWPNGIQKDSKEYACFYLLGTNKIPIPTSSSEWPKGNKLISPFVYQDDKLVGFCDTKAMEVGNATTIIMPYKHIEAEFSSIDKGSLQIATPKATFKKVSWKNSKMEDIPEAQYKYKGCKSLDAINAVDSNYKTTDIINGTWTEILCDLEDGNLTGNFNGGVFYNCDNLITFNSDLTSLTNSNAMFYNCSNLITFISDLSSLTNGEFMFFDCTSLTSFTSDLSSLTNGDQMFCRCSSLATFTPDLSSLTNGYRMFEDCPNLTTFNSDLSSLTYGSQMFAECRNLATFTSDMGSLTNGKYMFDYCDNLTTFVSNLRSLTNGFKMFYNCSNLTTFNSNLRRLTNGNYMFYNCNLDTTSVQNIANTIKDVSSLGDECDCSGVWKTIHIGIGNSSPNTEEDAAFRLIAKKGWTVYVNANIDASYQPANLTTLDENDENDEEITTLIPFYAKPVQTDEEHAHYIDDEGNYFNILGGQFIYGDDISTYGMFTSEADAAANMRLTPYIKPQSETIN